MKRAALLVPVLLLAGCAESKKADVSPGFTEAVTGLLKQVDPDVAPSFDAATCGSVFDSDPDAKVRMWAEVKIDGDVAKLRKAAVESGWQPQVNPSYALAVLSPDGVMLGIGDDLRVRAEQSTCSVDRHSELKGEFRRPELTDLQNEKIERAFKAGATTARTVLEGAGATPDPAVFPESGELREASRADVSNCISGDKRGAAWSAKGEATVDGTVDALHARAVEAVGRDWQVTPELTRGRGWVRAKREGVELQVFVDQRENRVLVQVEIRQAECVRVS